MKLTLKTLIGLLLLLGVGVSAFAVPRLREAAAHGREAAALECLRAIGNAQTVYREGDRDRNGVLDYAPTLDALIAADLIDRDLLARAREGYDFRVVSYADAQGSQQFLWAASADPREQDPERQRYFGTNMSGITYVSTETVVFDAQAQAPGLLQGCMCGEEAH